VIRTIVKLKKRAGVFQRVSDEPLVEVGEPKKGLHLLLVRQSGPLSNASDLDQVHCDRVVRDDHSEVFDCGLLELTLVGMEVKLVFSRSSRMWRVIFQCSSRVSVKMRMSSK